MKTINRTTKDIIDTDYKEFALYTLESRAIPSAIDGFKPVHRKLVYALNDKGGGKIKVAELGGALSSCVVGNTEITVNGHSIAISDYCDIWEYGDMISAFDTENKNYVDSIVKFCKKTKEVFDTITITTENGSVELTSDHLVLLSDGSWKEAGELTENDDLM